MEASAVVTILGKHPNLQSKKEKLEILKQGTFCIHNAWGIGMVTALDPESSRVTIDFENKKGHSMDIAFCVEKLQILEDDNIIVRNIKDRAAVEGEMKNPAEFVKAIISKKPDLSISSIELEQILTRLFADEKSYKNWWKVAKKDLERDPSVGCPKKKNDPYFLRAELKTPESEALEEYMLYRDPKKKIELAEKLHAVAENVDEIAEKLPLIRDELTEAIKKAKGLTQADRLRGIWVRNDFIRDIERKKYVEKPEDKLSPEQAKEIENELEKVEPRSKDILAETREKNEKDGLNILARNLCPAYYERFLDLLTRTYDSEWKDIIIDLLKNSEGRFTNECVNFLIGKDRQQSSKFTGENINLEATAKTKKITDESSCQQLVKAAFQKWLDEQTLHGPVILWIAKNRNSDKHKAMLANLINHKLLSALLSAIDEEALLSDSNRKIALAEALSEDKSLVLDLLAGRVLTADELKKKKISRDERSASDETARDLAQTLLLNQGFEDLTKKSILARFIRYSKEVQSLISSGAKQVERLFVSKWSLQARMEELDDIIKNQQPASKKAIEAARELGDLRENSEYKMAREHDEVLSARRMELERDISMAEPIDFSQVSTDRVNIGSVVTLQDPDGKQHVYTILGAWDSDTDKNIFSYKTPIAQAMMEKTVGDTFETNVEGHKTSYKILKIDRYVP